MHRVKVFLNSRASGGENPIWVEAIRRRLFRSEIEFLSPANIEELGIELDRAVAEKTDIVMSVGGDGTVNTLIQHLGNTNTGFMVIPAGTANDFAREIGIIGRVEQAVQSIRNGKPRKIDLIRINDRLMATNGGLGLAANVAAHVNEFRRRIPGFKSLMALMRGEIYSVVLGAELLSPAFRYYDFQIESDAYNGQVHTPLVMINNQASLGANFRVAPSTKNNDGTFNVTLFTHQSRADFIRCVARIRMGHPLNNDPHLITFETKRLHVRSFKPVMFYGDGETFDLAQDFEIVICPAALAVYGHRAGNGSGDDE